MWLAFVRHASRLFDLLKEFFAGFSHKTFMPDSKQKPVNFIVQNNEEQIVFL